MTDGVAREVVGLFQDEIALRSAADDIMVSGFDRSCLSLLADPETIQKVIGHPYSLVEDLGAEPDVPRVAYVGTDSRTEAEGLVPGALGYVGALVAAGAIVSSGGTLGAAIAAAAAAGGAGGLIGVVLSRLIGRHHARQLSQHLERGGLLLWVRVASDEDEQIAAEILKRHAGEAIHVSSLDKIDWTDLRGGVSYDLSFMNRLGM